MEACEDRGEQEVTSFTSVPEELQILVVKNALQHVQHDSRVFAKVALVNRDWTSLAKGFLQSLPSLSLVGCKSSGIPHSVAELNSLKDFSVISMPNITCFPPSTNEISDLCSRYGVDIRHLPLGFLRGVQVLRVVKCDGLKSLSRELQQFSCLEELHVENCQDLLHTGVLLGESLLVSLRRIHWDSPHLYFLPTDLDRCINLESVTLGSSTMVRIPPGAIRNLTKLRKLRLKLLELRSLPDEFQDLESLEEIWLQSDVLTRLPRSLAAAGTTPNLQVLSLVCPRLTYVPSTFGRSGSLLQLAVICGIHEPMKVSWKMLGMGCLRLLCLTVGDKPLPASAAAELTSLTELRLMIFGASTSKTDRKLALQIRASIERFIASIPSLTAISCLVQEPKTFPRVIKHSPNLQSLNISFQTPRGMLPLGSSSASGEEGIAAAWFLSAYPICNKLTSLKHNGPGPSDETSCLQTRCISGARNSALPSAKPGLSQLRRLKICGMGCSVLPPMESGHLWNLAVLELKDLPRLHDLPSGLSSLYKLSSLRIVSCVNLSGVQLSPSWVMLEVLHISGCPKVPSPGSSLQAFPRLRALVLGCEQMHPSPPQLDSLTALASFTVANQEPCTLKHTTALPASLGLLPSIRRIKACKACVACLGEVPASLSDLTALQSLEVKLGSKVLCVPGPQRLHRLPPQQVSELLAKAQELIARTALTTSWMPTSARCLGNLETLNLSHFPGLRLPPAIGQLQKLACLVIENCKYLQTLPLDIASLPNLLSLKLLHCGSLKSIAHAQEGYAALQEAACEGCPELQKPKGGRLGVVQLQVVPSTSHAGVKRLRSGKVVSRR